MNMKKRVVIAALLALAGCAQAPRKQAFDKGAAGAIRVLAIAQPQQEENYEAIVLRRPGMVLGLVGGLAGKADEHIKSRRLTAALDPAATRLQESFSKSLSDKLAGAGYQTQIVAVPGKPDDDATIDLLKKRAGNADAVLALSVEANYVAANLKSDYFPSVVVRAREVDVRTGKTLYEDTLTYGYRFARMETVHFAADEGYRFADMDALLAQPAKARAGLLAGLAPIVARIAADLKRN